jgi:hypothetical protein
MGGTITSDSLCQPSIFISASADSTSKNQFIEKLQVVKGVVRNGELLTSVHDVKTTKNQSTLDLSNCEVTGTGNKAMCTVWNDPDFDSSENAYYYVRVIANKSCRWSHDLCLKNPKYCDTDSDIVVPKFIQERAWTSPIWLETT